MERIRVLIVDDHASVRDALQVSLGSKPGLEVMVTGVESVVAAVEETLPDVVLLEPKTFGGKGLDTCRAILATRSPPAVIALTSWRDEREELALASLGVRHYLLKDIDSSRLHDEILSAIREGQ